MSKTDLHVIVYKLLRYVYEFNRHGILPDLMNAHDLVPVPERYFNQAVRELSYGGFVSAEFCSSVHFHFLLGFGFPLLPGGSFGRLPSGSHQMGYAVAFP